MKVLFVMDTLGAGGAERSLQEMLPLFERGGVDVHVACFHRRKVGVEHLVFGRHEVHVLEERGRLRQMARLRRIVRDQSFDLVHTTLFEADVYGRPAIAGLGIPVVTSLVNMPYEPARLRSDAHVNRLKLSAARGLEAITGHLFADHYHAITHAVKDSAATSFLIPPRKITVVYRGRDQARLGRRTPERRRRARAALGVPDDRFVVLTVGRQEFQKGQTHLVEAFAQTDQNDTEVWIAGREGNATPALTASIERSGVAGRIRRLGHREDVPELMCAADLFVLPSLWEGLGGVLIEAMALELPIVASDLPPVREVCEDGSCGRLVPAGDPRAMAAAIGEMRDRREERRRLAEAGRRRFETTFTLERSAAGMMRIFERARAGR